MIFKIRMPLFLLGLFIFETLLHPSFGFSSYRPEFAQSSNLAYARVLGLASLVIPGETSGILRGSSNIYGVPSQNIFTASYGYSGEPSHSADFAFINRQKKIVWGIEYIFNAIPHNVFVDNHLYSGNIRGALGAENLLAATVAYQFTDSGSFGLGFKLPLAYYSRKTNAGFLVDSSYNFQLYGFNFLLGIANLGAMYTQSHTSMVYPDLQMGIGYDYKANNGETLFALGLALENNLGEFINNSLALGVGGKVRLFSTNAMETRPLIEDSVLENQDFRYFAHKKAKAPLKMNIYLDFGFQFSHRSSFSIGITSQINDFLLGLGVMFPNEVLKRFGLYVSVGCLF